DRLGRRHPDAQAGEQAGPDVDGDQSDLAELDAGLTADELDGRGEVLGVALGLAGVRRGEHALVASDGAARLHRRGLDAQDQHSPTPSRSVGAPRSPVPASASLPAPPSVHGASAAPRARTRADHRGPTGRSSTMRRSNTSADPAAASAAASETASAAASVAGAELSPVGAGPSGTSKRRWTSR